MGLGDTGCMPRALGSAIGNAAARVRQADYFIGSIVYIEAGLSQVTHQAPLLVIDGQQRLTTVTLLLAALASALGESLCAQATELLSAKPRRGGRTSFQTPTVANRQGNADHDCFR